MGEAVGIGLKAYTDWLDVRCHSLHDACQCLPQLGLAACPCRRARPERVHLPPQLPETRIAVYVLCKLVPSTLFRAYLLPC